jgi:hypothetical protein
MFVTGKKTANAGFKGSRIGSAGRGELLYQGRSLSNTGQGDGLVGDCI